MKSASFVLLTLILAAGIATTASAAAIPDGKVAVVHWCRERGCGDAIEEKANSSVLGTDVRSPYISSSDGPCIICGKPGKATLVGRTY